ncbi:MAG TPA: 5-(carboxyamino)imidazole ribonucleotide synthase [Candidatus Paceibacterota bacterium]|nr:5-(carboxyamino)imidazole ribonucleotide synthase [Candidatus Paceibacterota bacterium]
MKTIGIAGGGQLGRMLAEAAHVLGFKIVVLDPTPGSPAGQVADEQIVGDYKDGAMLRALAEKSDFLTYEIESVNADVLEELSTKMPVNPSPKTLGIIKDKLTQKRFLQEHGIPVAEFSDDVEHFGYPYILKARSGGFDGRGNALVEKAEALQAAQEKLKGAPAYAERVVPFEKELAIVAARTAKGEMQIFPLVETMHKNHICHMVLAPAPVSKEVAQKAHDLAQKVLASFDGAGVFAIEMFLANGEVLVNEVAPRVHNSGHFTIEACHASQFEQHIRAISGMPLGNSSMKVPAAVMINILGERSGTAEPRGVEEAEKIEGVKVHIYGKMETRPERKMGHLTAVADTLEEAKEKAEKARALISI